MKHLSKRLDAMANLHREKVIVVWDEKDEPTDAEIADLKRQGVKVIIVRWVDA